MQISASEVARLLTAEVKGVKTGEVDMEFQQVTPDSLPETREPDAAEVKRVVEMVNAAPDVREDIVMQLKDRIEKGEYKVSGEEVADMILRRMRADRVR